MLLGIFIINSRINIGMLRTPLWLTYLHGVSKLYKYRYSIEGSLLPVMSR